jgi:hypothetical protein
MMFYFVSKDQRSAQRFMPLKCAPDPELESLEVKVTVHGRLRRRGVALQVAFERQTLKPVFSLDRF